MNGSITAAITAAITARLAAGETLMAIADGAGVPRPVLSRWWAGSRPDIRLQTADRLAAYLGVRCEPPAE